MKEQEVSFMKPLEIKAARIRLRLTQKNMAKQLGITAESYGNKERGSVRFTAEEIVIVSRALGLNIVQVNDFFFDGGLPIG